VSVVTEFLGCDPFGEFTPEQIDEVLDNDELDSFLENEGKDRFGEEVEEKIRVRVYELIFDGVWKDKGTGNLYIREDRELVVICEEGDSIVLEHMIQYDIDYELQGKTIIAWLEPGGEGNQPKDLAISFQEEEACEVTFNFMSDVKESCIDVDEATSSDHESEPPVDHLATRIPMPTRPNLNMIAQSFQKAEFVEWFNSENVERTHWFEFLYQTLELSERERDFKSCEQIYNVIQNALMFGSQDMIALVCAEEYIEKLIHIAEYTPQRLRNKPPNEVPMQLRKLLKKADKPILLPDYYFPPLFLQTVKRLYNLMFVRDCALFTHLDETAIAYLNRNIYEITTDVTKRTLEDEHLTFHITNSVRELSEQKLAEPSTKGKLLTYVGFIRDLVLFRIKKLNFNDRKQMIPLLLKKGVLRTLYLSISSGDSPSKHPTLWRQAIESINQIIAFMGMAAVRDFIMQQHRETPDHTLMGRLTKAILQPCPSGLLCQIVYTLRAMLMFNDGLSPETLHLRAMALGNFGIPESCLETVWRYFHDQHVETLLSVFSLEPNPSEFPIENLNSAKCYVVQILKNCIEKQNFNKFIMKHTILNHSILQKVAKLIEVPRKNFPIP